LQYLLYEAVPSEPFQLDQARFVSDPVSFLVRLYRDVQVGPEGPRARTRALQEDLRLLYTSISVEPHGEPPVTFYNTNHYPCFFVIVKQKAQFYAFHLGRPPS